MPPSLHRLFSLRRAIKILLACGLIGLLLAHPTLKKYTARWIAALPISSRTFGPPKGYITAWEMSREKGCSIEYVAAGSFSTFRPIFKEMPANQAYPPQYLLRLAHARVYSDKGVVIGPSDWTLYESTREFGSPTHKNPIFEKMYLPKISPLQGSWALLAVAGQYTYYHWMLEVLPRFEVLEKTKARYDGLLVPKLRLPFMQESLAMLGVPLSACKELDKRCHIDVEELLVPSLPTVPTNKSVPLSAIHYLRKRFENYRQLPCEHSAFIFVSRSKAPSRRIVNEQALFNYLQPYGFEKVFLEDLSLAQQISLFAHAQVVIAPHGSGLTNLVFCPPSTQVIEIHSPFWLVGCFASLCQQLQLSYKDLYGKAVLGDRCDIEVDMASFQEATHAILEQIQACKAPSPSQL